MIIEHIKRGWEAYRRNFEPFAGAILISIFAAAFPIILGLLLVIFISAPSFGISSGPMNILWLPSFILATVLIISGIILGISLQGGMYAMADESLRKKKTSVNTMVETAKRRWKSFVGATLLSFLAVFSAIVAIGLVLGIFAIFAGLSLSSLDIDALPFAVISGLLLTATALAASLLLSLVNPAVVSGKGAFESVKASYKAAKRNLAGLAGFVIPIGVISFAVMPFLNVLGVLINTFVLAPLLIIALTDFYAKNSKKG